MEMGCSNVRIIAVLSVATLLTAAGPSSQDRSLARCIPAVNDLRYLALALSGRIMGTVAAAVAFNDDGAVASIHSEGYPDLVVGVETALRSAPVSATCSGEKVAMRFSFVLDQDLDPKTPISIKAVSAFDYEILAPSGWSEVTISDPAWLFTRKGRFLHRVKMVTSRLKFW
jgi:hypothetical protein